ncbi:MAG TPA: GFA family protein [Bdellovibrio sp.]|nr:GFA family protein [Bdellovibrio sp.]
MKNTFSGSCLCQSVKFQIDGRFDSFYLCHCKYCQKDTGSAHAANLFSTNAQLTWIVGKDKVKTYNLPSTRHTKSFCKECGAAVPTESKDPAFLTIPAGSLDTEIDMKPQAHIFCSSKASWEKDLESVSKFEKFPG